MSAGLILLGVVGWGIGVVFLLLLFRMAGEQDRAARHQQKRCFPTTDVTITRTGR